MKPAMTAQQWSEWKGEARKTTVVEENGDTLELHRGDKGEGAPEGGVHHAIAAAALHGKSFGFTAADVAMVRRLAAEGCPDGYVSGPIDGLADRIEALLCPAEVSA